MREFNTGDKVIYIGKPIEDVSDSDIFTINKKKRDAFGLYHYKVKNKAHKLKDQWLLYDELKIKV